MPDLFSPIEIAGRVIPNRIVMPAMTTRLAQNDGDMTDELIEWYRARAAGGAGLITVEMSSPSVSGRHRLGEVGVYDRRFLPGLKRLVDAIHGEGRLISIQLGHAGSRAASAVTGVTPLAPSEVSSTVVEGLTHSVMPKSLTKAQILQLREDFSNSALMVRDAGFDFVELHGAHGYLISQFLSPYENRRQDEYGGSLENRARFGLELLHELKSACPDLPVIFRLGVEDFFDGGIHIDEAIQVSRWVAEGGASALSVSAGHHRSLPSAEMMIPPMIYPDGIFLDLAAKVKTAVDIPVIAVGRLNNSKLARSAIEDGRADLIALGRQLIADPDWPNRVRDGLPVRRCLACNYCAHKMVTGETISCVVNGRAGRETQMSLAPKHRGKNIAIIGAGPAGLAYASLVGAANRVTVFERSAKTGGSFRFAGKAPYFGEVIANHESFARHIAEMEARCRIADVEFKFNSKVDAKALKGFDQIVVATGARLPLGLTPVIFRLLDFGIGGTALAKWIFKKKCFRDWLYYKGRKSTAQQSELEHPCETIIIGDAIRPGLAREAIASAFAAALAQKVESGPSYAEL